MSKKLIVFDENLKQAIITKIKSLGWEEMSKLFVIGKKIIRRKNPRTPHLITYLKYLKMPNIHVEVSYGFSKDSKYIIIGFIFNDDNEFASDCIITSPEKYDIDEIMNKVREIFTHRYIVEDWDIFYKKSSIYNKVERIKRGFGRIIRHNYNMFNEKMGSHRFAIMRKARRYSAGKYYRDYVEAFNCETRQLEKINIKDIYLFSFTQYFAIGLIGLARVGLDRVIEEYNEIVDEYDNLYNESIDYIKNIIYKYGYDPHVYNVTKQIDIKDFSIINVDDSNGTQKHVIVQSIYINKRMCEVYLCGTTKSRLAYNTPYLHLHVDWDQVPLEELARIIGYLEENVIKKIKGGTDYD